MSKNTELQALVATFERQGKSAEDLNHVRKQVFDAFDLDEITEKQKNKLLKDLYFTASLKGIFFVRVMERNTQDLPKNEQEELDRQEEDESYEESYSYSYEEDEPEEDEEAEEESK